MKLLYRIDRRIKVNRTLRELSRLNATVLKDIGFEQQNPRRAVEDLIDSVGPNRV